MSKKNGSKKTGRKQQKKKVEHPIQREAERQKELKKLEAERKKLFCFKCGKEIPFNHKMKEADDGKLIGKCLSKKQGGCQGKTIFVNSEVLNKKKLPKATEILKSEEEKVISFQKDPALIIKLIKETQKEVAGEEDTITALIIVALTRLVDNAIPESTNLLLSDKTGIGKDWVTKKTLEVIIPPEQHLHVTKMSNEAFTYWHYKDKNWNWDNKVIHFEDVKQSLLNCSTFKTMASGENKAVVVKKQETLEIPVPGKPCMILTSHHANPEDEALRRFRIGGLNETEEQTRNVMDKISRKYAGESREGKNYLLRKSVWDLGSYKVIIPFAEIIQHYFPATKLMRTHYQCFLNYICASAVLHQHQRKKTEKNEIIARPDDYMIARMVLIYTTSNPLMVPLSNEQEEIIQIIKEKGPLSIKDLDPLCSFSKSWLYQNLPDIVATGLIQKGSEYKEDANKNVTTYQYTQLTAKMIPTWGEMIEDIQKIINKTKKTKKTKACERLKNWFYTSNGKPKKPIDEATNDFLVLHEHKIPLNREVLQVFPVFQVFLREKDEKRYQKYYQPTQSIGEKQDFSQETLDQVNDLRKLKDFFGNTSDNGFVSEKAVKAFIKNKIGKNNPENYLSHLYENGVLTNYSNKGVKFTGECIS